MAKNKNSEERNLIEENRLNREEVLRTVKNAANINKYRRRVQEEDEDLAAVGFGVGQAASAMGVDPKGNIGGAIKFGAELYREATTPIAGLAAKATDAIGLTDDLSLDLFSRNQAYQSAAAQSPYRGFENEKLQFARDVIKSAAAQAPTLAAGMLTGTEGLLLLYASQSLVQGINEAELQNKPRGVQLANGMTKAASEYFGTKAFSKVFPNTLEEIVGGSKNVIKNLGITNKKQIEQASKNLSTLTQKQYDDLRKTLDRSFVRTAAKIGIENVTPEMAEEMFVEGLQSAASSVYGIDPKALEFQQLIESSMMAAATAGLLTSSVGAGAEILNRRRAKQFLEQEELVEQGRQEKRKEIETAEKDRKSQLSARLAGDLITGSGQTLEAAPTAYSVLQQIIDGKEKATPELFITQLQKNGLSEDEARLAMNDMVESGNVEFSGETLELSIKRRPKVVQKPTELDDLLSFDTESIEAVITEQGQLRPIEEFTAGTPRESVGERGQAVEYSSDAAEQSLPAIVDESSDDEIKRLLVVRGLEESALDAAPANEIASLIDDIRQFNQLSPDRVGSFIESSVASINEEFRSDRKKPPTAASSAVAQIKQQYTQNIGSEFEEELAVPTGEDNLRAVLRKDGRTYDIYSFLPESNKVLLIDENGNSRTVRVNAIDLESERPSAVTPRAKSVPKLEPIATEDQQTSDPIPVSQPTDEQVSETAPDVQAEDEQVVVSEELEVADDREQEEEVDDDDVEEVIDGDLLLDDDVAVLARKVAEDVRDEIFDMSDEEYEDISSALDDLIDTTASNPRKKAAKEKLVSFAQEFNYDEEDIPNQQPRSVKSGLRRVAPQPTVSIVEDKQLTDYGRSLLVEGDLDALDQLLNPSSELPKITPTEGEARGINDGPLNKIEEGTIRTHSINGETKNSDELDPEIRDRLVAARSAIENQLEGMRLADIRALGREIEKVSRDRGDEATIAAATGRGRAALTDDFLSQVSRNFQVQINNRSKSPADAPQSRSDQDMVDMIQGILSDDAQTERSTEGSTPQAGAQAAPRRLGKSSPSRSQRAAEAVQDAQAARDAARAEFLAAFKSSVTTSAGGLGFLTDERVTRALANLIFNEAKYGQAKLKEVVALVADMIEPENAVLLKDKMVKIWGALSDNGVTDPVSDNEVQEAFAPYEKAEEDESTDRLAGGQGGTGVEPVTGDVSTDQAGREGDGLGDVSQSPVTPDGVDEQESGGGRGLVSGSVEGSDGTTAESRQEGDDVRSSTDGRVSGDPSGQDADTLASVPDESESERGSRTGDRGRREPRSIPESPDVEDKPRLVAYKAGSDLPPLGVYVPENQAVALEKSIRAVIERRGDLVSFVAKESGISKDHLLSGKALYAEQLDALALAIDSHLRGRGFILGDMTGIGKGRVVAGMIAYAKKQGKFPVFLTAKEGLYTSMMEDLAGIGIHKPDSEFRPFLTNARATYDLNEKLAAEGFEKNIENRNAATSNKFAAGLSYIDGGKRISHTDGRKKKHTYDGVFTTYSQITSADNMSERRNLLDRLAPNAIFILDESHKATGSGSQSADSDRVNTSDYIKGLLRKSEIPFFSSATFAREAKALELYSSTGIARSLDNPSSLGGLLQSGGDALLQIVSQQAVGEGTMIRRERDMEGTETTPVTVKTPEGFVDNIATILSSLQSLSRQANSIKKTAARIPNGKRTTKQALIAFGERDLAEKINSTEFRATSFSSNISRVMSTVIVAQKVQATIDRSIQAIRNGEKPLIVIDSTASSAMEDFMKRNELSFGDIANFTLEDIIIRQLIKLREFNYKQNVDGKVVQKTFTIPLERLGAEFQEAYASVESIIRSMGLDKYSGSPIDAIKNGIERESVRLPDGSSRKIKIGEITGRGIKLAEVNGQTVFESVSQSSADKLEVVNGYNNGGLDGAIVNKSAAEGFSMHASVKAKDQRKRRMLVVEFPPSIDQAVQLQGRINRTGQVVSPAYDLLVTDMPHEQRGLSIYLKKLKSMNANVTASTDSSATDLDLPDVMNKVGGQVLYAVLKDLDLELMSNTSIYDAMDERPPNPEKESSYANADWVGNITRKMAMLPRDIQASIWSELTSRFNSRIAELDARGENPLSAAALPLEAETIATDVLLEPNENDPDGVTIETVRAKEPNLVMNSSSIAEAVGSSLGMSGQDYIASSTDPDIDLESSQKQYFRDFVDAARESSNKFVDEKVESLRQEDSLTGDEIRAKSDAMASLNSNNIRIIGSVASLTPGTVISLETRINVEGQEYVDRTEGVVLAHTNKANLANPTSLSQYFITIATLDPRVKVEIPYSQFGHGKQYRAVVANSSPNIRMAAFEKFDEAAKEVEVVKQIATGNVLRAFEKLKRFGSVVFYTDSAGNIKPGVLIRGSGFSVDSFKASQPIRMNSAEEAAQVLMNFGSLQTLDGSVHIYHSQDLKALDVHRDSPAVAMAQDEFIGDVSDWEDSFSGRFSNHRKVLRKYIENKKDFISFIEEIEPYVEDVGGLHAVEQSSMDIVNNFREGDEPSVEVSKMGPEQAPAPKRLGKKSRLRPIDEVISEQQLEEGIRIVNPLRPSAIQNSVDYINEVRSNPAGDPLAPLESGAVAVQAQTLVNTLDRIFKIPTWVGILNPKKARGAFIEYANKRGGPDVINLATQAESSIFVRLHEMAHGLDRRHSFVNDYRTGTAMLKQGDPVFEELKSLDYEYIKDLRIAQSQRAQQIQANGVATTPLPDVSKYSAKEGFAEFFRRYMTETSVNGLSDLKNETPLSVEWFNTQVLPNNKGLKSQVDEALEVIGKFVDQPLLTRVMAQIGRQPEADLSQKHRFESKFKTLVYQARKKITRRAIALHRFDKQAKQAAKELGYSLESLEMSKRYASQAKAERALDEGVFYEDETNAHSSRVSVVENGVTAEFSGSSHKGLFRYANELLKDDIEYEEVQAFALARHIKYLSGKKQFQDYKSIMTESEADQILQAFMKRDPDQYQRFEDMSKVFSVVARELLLMKVEAGAMDPAEYNRIYEAYGAHNYFPMFRIEGPEYGQDMIDLSFLEERLGGSRQTSGLRTKRRSKFGSGKAVENPFVSLQKMAGEYYHQAAQASILADIVKRVEMAKDDELGWFAEVIDGEHKPTSIQLRTQMKALVKQRLISDDTAKVALSVADAKDAIEEAVESGRSALDGLKEFSMDQQGGGTAAINNISGHLGLRQGGVNFWASNNALVQQILSAIDNKVVPDASGILTQWRFVQESDANYNVAVVYVNGRAKRVRMEKGVYDLTTSLGGPHRGMFSRSINAANKLFKNIVIGWSLDFAVQDLFVNMASGLIRSSSIKERSAGATARRVIFSPTKQILKFVLPEISEKVFSPFSDKFVRDRAKMKSSHILYRNIGGSAYSIIGGSRGAKERAAARKVKRGLKKRQGFIQRASNINPLSKEPYMNLVLGIKDKAAGFLDILEYITALTDVPARLANAEAYLESKGYEDIGGGLFKDPSGTPVSKLPKEILVGFADAVASAGPNFKQGGDLTQIANPLWPFLNSSIQANTTELIQMKEMFGDLKRPDIFFDPSQDSLRLRRSRRQLAMLVATGSFGFLLQMLRGDDEDYVNGEEQNQRYWTWGWNGKTMLRIKKNPGDAWVSNIAASVAQDMFGGYGAKDRSEIIKHAAISKALPMGRLPGGAVGALFQGLANTDTWGKPIVKPYIIAEGTSASYMYDESTSDLAKWVGYYTGKFGLQVGSPIVIQHMANQALGSLPKEIEKVYETAEAAFTGDLSQFRANVSKIIPAAGSIVPNSRQIQPIYDLFAETDEKNQKLANMKKMGLEGTEPYINQSFVAGKFQNYSDLVRSIRKKGYNDKSIKDVLDGYANGVARFAQKLGDSEGSPNIFNMEIDMMPEEVREGFMEFIEERTAGVMPITIGGGRQLEGESYYESKMRYMDLLANRFQWIEEHMKYPAVRSSVDKQLQGQEGRSILRSLKSGRPRVDMIETGITQDEYKALVMRYYDLKVRAIQLVSGVIRDREK